MLKRCRHCWVLICAAAVLLLTCAAHAQLQIQQGPPAPPVKSLPRKVVSEDRLMVERARRAEQMGEYVRAVSIWKGLLDRSPWNPEALQAVPRCLLLMKQYDVCDSFLVARIEKSAYRTEPPADDPTSTYSLRLLQGQTALARGDEARAWEIWNRALSETGRSAEAVRALGTMLLHNRRWEESEKLIRDFRKESKQPGFMAIELASSLKGQMNYAGAAEELILYANSMPSGWQLALNYLDQFPDDSLVSNKVTAVLRKAVQRDRRNPVLWRLVAGYALKTGELEESLEATTAADSLGQEGGTLVLAAAQQMIAEGDVSLAQRAYQRVLAWKPAADVAARAELGLGRCFEEIGRWNEAKQSYQTFVERHPNFKEVDIARFRIGEILLNHDRDATAALSTFQSLWQRPKGVAQVLVGLRIGDCYAWKGTYEDAISAWTNVVRLDQPLGEAATQALFRIARANVWRDSTRLAQDVLDSITSSNPTNTAFNDAVLYTALLEEGGVYRAQRAFAAGDYAEFRNEDSLAAAKFGEAADLIKYGRLAEWARVSQALALRASGQPAQAIVVLDSFVVRYPESVDLDRAEYLRALIRTEDLHDDRTALAELRQFLMDHPRSLYLEQARRKARILTARVS